jgi:hypothetical protein
MKARARTLLAGSIVATIMWPIAASADPVLLQPGARLDLISAALELPTGVTRLPDGTLVVAEAVTSGTDPDGRLSTITCDGVTTVLSTGFYSPAYPIVIGNTVYVIDRGPNAHALDPDGMIWQDAATNPSALATGFTTPFEGVRSPDDPTKLLITELSHSPISGHDGAILAVGLDDGDVYTYFDDGPGGLSNLAGIAVTPGGEVLFCDNGAGNCYRYEDVDTAVPLADPGVLVSPGDIAVNDAGDVFVADDTVGLVQLHADGTTTQLVASSGALRGLHIEGDVILFVPQGTGQLYRVDLTAYDLDAWQAVASCWLGPDEEWPVCDCRFRDEDADMDYDLLDFVVLQQRFGE